MNTEIVEVRENKLQLGFAANENFREKMLNLFRNKLFRDILHFFAKMNLSTGIENDEKYRGKKHEKYFREGKNSNNDFAGNLHNGSPFHVKCVFKFCLNFCWVIAN